LKTTRTGKSLEALVNNLALNERIEVLDTSSSADDSNSSNNKGGDINNNKYEYWKGKKIIPMNERKNSHILMVHQ